MKTSYSIISFLLILFSITAVSEEIEFKVIALFKNAAMIEHQGKNKILRNGQSYLQKIKLLSADSHGAKFLVNGETILLGLHQSKMGTSVFSNEKNKPKKSVSILRDRTGMYRTSGFINGVPVKFLVDTGATQVAMNEVTARKVSLQYRLYGQKSFAYTAAGKVTVWNIPLKKVNVGGVELKQVDAAVIAGVGPQEVLLGMSFLKQLKMEDNNGILKLTKKF